MCKPLFFVVFEKEEIALKLCLPLTHTYTHTFRLKFHFIFCRIYFQTETISVTMSS